jgi:uncharacterized protein involved in exopolysaccharide biosynthesis
MPPATTPPWSKACHALFRHKAKTVLVFLTVLGAAAAATAWAPRAYRSEAQLFVRLGRENALLDPTATLGQPPVVAVPSSREAEINSVLEMLRSRALLEEVVDRVGPQEVLGLAGPEGPDDRYRATTALTRKLTVEALKKSSVLRIAFEGHSPEACQKVVAALVELYLAKHVHLNRAPGAHQFLTDQGARLRDRLGVAEGRLCDLKNQTGLIAPEAQRQALAARLARLEDELQQAATAAAAAAAEVRSLRQKAAALPRDQVTRTTGLPNVAADGMRGQLYALQIKEIELLAKYPERHPEVQLVRQQTAAAKALLAREEGAREQVTTAPNRLSEEAHLALLRHEPLLASLRARADALRAELGRERQRLDQFSHDQLRLARLQREVDLQDAHYRKYADSLEQARIDQALEAQRISNINVVQPATYDDRPVRPRRALTLALGLLCAALSSLGLATLLHCLDRSFHSPQDVEEKLGLPTLAAIPRLSAQPLAPNGKS